MAPLLPWEETEGAALTTSHLLPPSLDDRRRSRDEADHRHHEDHRRAEELLARADTLGDTPEAARLRQEAVVLTMDLADACARRYRGRGVELDDLVQVARMALVKAVQGYRPDRGRDIGAYAVATIVGELKKYFRDHGWSVRPPRRLQEQRAEIVAEQERLWHLLHRDPTAPELAAALGLDVSDVRAALLCATAYRSDSLDAVTTQGTSLAHFLASPKDEYDTIETRLALRALLDRLPARDRQLIHLRFVEELTQSEIGERIGVSQMQVSRLLASVIARLRGDLVAPPQSA